MGEPLRGMRSINTQFQATFGDFILVYSDLLHMEKSIERAGQLAVQRSAKDTGAALVRFERLCSNFA